MWTSHPHVYYIYKYINHYSLYSLYTGDSEPLNTQAARPGSLGLLPTYVTARGAHQSYRKEVTHRPGGRDGENGGKHRLEAKRLDPTCRSRPAEVGRGSKASLGSFRRERKGCRFCSGLSEPRFYSIVCEFLRTDRTPCRELKMECSVGLILNGFQRGYLNPKHCHFCYKIQTSDYQGCITHTYVTSCL